MIHKKELSEKSWNVKVDGLTGKKKPGNPLSKYSSMKQLNT